MTGHLRKRRCAALNSSQSGTTQERVLLTQERAVGRRYAQRAQEAINR